MSENLIQAAAKVGAVSVTAIVTFLVAKMQHKGKPENALIDQLQQEMGRMRTRMDALEMRDRIYIPIFSC